MPDTSPLHPLPGLPDFVGHWHLVRQIADQLGPPGRFHGTARLTPEGQGLTYHEQGLLQLGDGPAFAAERRYVWRAEGSQIAVDFADGRPFHSFDAGQALVTARHDCAPDLYLVQYDFTHWPLWRVEWRVSGPRKDYRMETTYQRPGADVG